MSRTFGADSMSVFTVVAHQILKGQLCFVSLVLMWVCICTSYIRAFDKGDSKPVPEPAFNVLRKEQQTEQSTSCSARLSFPAGICVLLWNWCLIMEQMIPCFTSRVWKMHVWFTVITDGMKKHFKSRNSVYNIKNHMINKS